MNQEKHFTKFTELVNCAKDGSSLNWLLVMPRITQFDDLQYGFPIGIAYVSSALKTSGRNVFTLNMNYKNESDYDILYKSISQNNIDIIAAGGISVQYPLLKGVFDAAKQIKPNIITVGGGGIITSDPIPAMTALKNVDYGIMGEGEITICELAYALENNIDISLINGIIYKTGDQWAITLPREEINDLDMIPWPDYDGFEYTQMLSKTPIDILTANNLNEKMGFVFFSRSCPYNCTFCFHSSGKKYRTRTIDSFFEEFDYLMKKYLLNNVFFADEYFLRDIEFVREFCERIKPYCIKWSCSGRVDNISKEMLEILMGAGCYRVGFGIESANDHILKSMRKYITREQIEKAFTLCQEIGMEAQGNIIFGDLEETVETATDTINWWRMHQNWAITLHWIIAYPGSHVYRISRERGIIPDPVQFIKAGCPEVNFSKMTSDERKRIASIIDTLVNEKHDILTNISFSKGTSGKITLTGECPYCRKMETFLNLDPIRPIKLDICPSCNKALRLYVSDYTNPIVFDDNLKYLLSLHKIAIWPVITGIVKLFETSKLLSDKNIFFVDSSPYKQGTEFCGKTIQSPDVISDQEVDMVIITTSTSVGSDIVNTIKTNYLNVQYIEFIGNLFFKL